MGAAGEDDARGVVSEDVGKARVGLHDNRKYALFAQPPRDQAGVLRAVVEHNDAGHDVLSGIKR